MSLCRFSSVCPFLFGAAAFCPLRFVNLHYEVRIPIFSLVLQLDWRATVGFCALSVRAVVSFGGSVFKHYWLEISCCF